MFDKKKLVLELQKNPLFIAALNMARDDAERSKITAIAGSAMSRLADAFQPVVASMTNASHMEVQESTHIVNERDGSISSGSVG